MIAEAPTAYALADVVQQRRWQFFMQPFPHYVAQDVFTQKFYEILDRAYGELLGRGLSERQDSSRFSRSIKNYDVYSMNFDDELPEVFQVFTSTEWHDMLANMTGIDATRDVNGGFHHHLSGSKHGQVHNDLNPGWFLDSEDPGTVNISRNDLCSYSGGLLPGVGLPVHETVRALAVIYFLHNPPWRASSGGVTGLYTGRRQPILSPTKSIPPINNSLFMFECRPNSFHTFIGNREGPRNSLIMWLHRAKHDAIERWGEDAIVYWNDRPRN